MRIPLATQLRTRVGDTSKDARLKNAYAEVRGEQSVVRHRPSARGGVEVGTGTAQGGVGFSIGDTDYFIGFWGDSLTSYTGSGTSWASGTSYSIGDHVSYGWVDYWALTDHSGSQPPSADWSTTYVPAVPFAGTYANLNAANVVGTISITGDNKIATVPYDAGTGGVKANIGKNSGKWYWEQTITSFATNQGSYLHIGVATVSSNLMTGIWACGSGLGLGFSNGWTVHDSTYTEVGEMYSTNDVIGFALDLDSATKKLYFYKNGVLQSDITIVTTAALYPCIFKGLADTPSVPDIVITANFGASDFVYSVPSGYNRGFYTL